MESPEVASLYLDVKEFVIRAGFASEVDWQAGRDFNAVTERQFLAEGAWVILCSGFKERIVRDIFPQLSRAFLDWIDANAIMSQLDESRTAALSIFANERKIGAICTMVVRVAERGFPEVRKLIAEGGTRYLTTFPQIGEVTGMHLLKNLGVPVAKPDRHLKRIAMLTGFPSVAAMCASISRATGDSVAEIDSVLWRYATLVPDYQDLLLRALQGSTRYL